MKLFLSFLVVAALTVWFGVKDALLPSERAGNENSIYTLGNDGYRDALESGKRVVKFGPMFWGIYPGGLAFSSPREARNYFQANSQVFLSADQVWSVYQLAGDFHDDTYEKDGQKYIKKSLIVFKLVEPLPVKN